MPLDWEQVIVDFNWGDGGVTTGTIVKTGTGRIKGRVITADTGAPVRRARSTWLHPASWLPATGRGSTTTVEGGPASATAWSVSAPTQRAAAPTKSTCGARSDAPTP